MSAEAAYRTVVKNDYAVRIHYGRNSLCNYYLCCAGDLFRKCLAYLCIGSCIYGACAVVKDKHLGLFQQCPCDT